MKHKGPIRLLQASPLLVLALAVALWAFVPPSVRTISAELRAWNSRPELPMRDATQAVVSRLLQERSSLTGDALAVDTAANELGRVSVVTADRIMREPSRLYDARGKLKPIVLADSDEALSVLRDYEHKTGARTAIFVVPPLSRPTVAMRAGDLELLTAEERSELSDASTLESLRHAARGADPAELPVNTELGGGAVDTVNKRYVMYSALRSSGDVYEIYGVFPQEDATLALDLPFDIQVGTAQAQRALRRTAERYGATVVVIGPVNGDPIALRVPDGLDAARLAAYAKDSARQGIGSDTIASLTAEQAGDLNARYVGVVETGSDGSYPVSAKGRRYARQPLLVVATYRNNPQTPYDWQALGKTPAHVAQVWLAANGLTVAAVLGVLFLGSLAAAPVAFTYERSVTQAEALERERERVRKAARDKVVQRLTELSEQVETASARASERTRREVTDVARDIELTVAELRDILEDVSDTGGVR